MLDINFEALKQSIILFSDSLKILLNSPLCGVRIKDFFFLLIDEILFFYSQRY